VAVLVIVVAGWFGWKHWFAPKPAAKGPAVTTVATAIVQQGDVPLEVNANGNVVAMQTVEVRPQVSSTVRTVHIKEGQSVKPGDLLFSLDTRMDEANLDKARAQLMRDQADLSDARRTLTQPGAAAAQLHLAQRRGYGTGQGRRFRSHDSRRPGRHRSEPRGHQLRHDSRDDRRPDRRHQRLPGLAGHADDCDADGHVAQIAPITVMFTLPERQLAALREALRSGPVSVTALPNDGSKQPVTGKITFVDNTVDPQYGSIRVKAMFGNEEHRLWPGTYANVNATVQVLKDALSVPPQAVVTGPEGRFVYTVQADNKVARVPVQVIATTAAAAVIEGVQPGARVVTEGAQNLRPGSLVRKPPLAALRPRRRHQALMP
jgi:multidrug efflux pump subunit AcrA (membrane-fusion protein)